jgi:hypothetical protein
VKRAALAVSVCFGMAPSAASALDWSLKTTQSETVELNDNQFLRSSPAASVGSYSTITANAEALTATSKFDFDADSTYQKWWGPGGDGVPESLNYGFKARYEQTEKNVFDREFVEANWRQQSTALALLNELGVITSASGFIDRLTASGGIDRAVTSQDTLRLFAASTSTSYEPASGGLPFTDTLANGTWQHRLNSIVSLTASSEVEVLDFSNSFNTRVTLLRDKVGVDATLSPLLSFRGAAGPAYIETIRGVPTSGLNSSPVSGAVTDWIGDAVLTYKMLKSTILTLTASQSIGPTIVGSLFKTDSVALGLVHSINAGSTLSFSASGTRSISTTTTDYVSTSVTYGHTFTREWTAQLSYRYLHRFASTGTATVDPITGTPTVSGTGPANSNSLMLVVSHNFTVLPRGN